MFHLHNPVSWGHCYSLSERPSFPLTPLPRHPCGSQPLCPHDCESLAVPKPGIQWSRGSTCRDPNWPPREPWPLITQAWESVNHGAHTLGVQGLVVHRMGDQQGRRKPSSQNVHRPMVGEGGVLLSTKNRHKKFFLETCAPFNLSLNFFFQV